jgi:hypothetical protein
MRQDDAVLYPGIRLEALQANPEAFGRTFAVENAQPLSWFPDRLGSSTVLGAFGEPVRVTSMQA